MKLKIEKEIEDLKLIIESKNNQVESKNKHIKRLERIISNIKRKILIEHDSGRQKETYKSANKADLSFYYWERPKILDSTAD